MVRRTFNKDEINKYRGECGMNWADICRILKCDIATLRRWKKETGYVDPLTGNQEAFKSLVDRFDVEEIKELREKGWSWHEICNYKHVTFNTIKIWREQVKFVEPSKQGKSKSPIFIGGLERRKIVKDYRSGLSKIEIGVKYDLPPEAVHAACRTQKTLYEQIKETDWGKIGALNKAGWHTNRIAMEMSVEPIVVIFVRQCLEKMHGTTANKKVKGLKLAKRFKVKEAL